MLSSNPWEYFYEFLHRSNRANWTDAVERDFGDIHHLSFKEWWEQVGDWFEPLEPWTIREMDSVEEFEDWHGGAFGPELYIAVNLFRPKKVILDELSKLIDERVESRPGKPKFLGWTVSDYHLVAEPDLQALDNFLRAYDLNQMRLGNIAGAPKTLYDIGVKMGISSHTVRATDKPDVATELATAKTQAMSSLVSKYIKRANQIIAGCEQGLFPAADDNPVDPTKE